MIVEFADNQYVDVDQIQAIRWIKQNDIELGVVVLAGDKIVVTEREEFDAIESAFIWARKSSMFDKDMKKIRYVKRGTENE